MPPKIAVCITAQENSKRLISKGAEIRNSINGELHVLHVQKGDNIFNSKEAPALLEDLFRFGSNLGGVIHAVSSENIPHQIYQFVAEENITHIIMGECPDNHMATILDKIIDILPEDVEIITIARQVE